MHDVLKKNVDGTIETCNRYTNAGMGKEALTCEAVEKTTKETGPKGESCRDVLKLDGISCKSMDASKSYSSGRYYKAETDEGTYCPHERHSKGTRTNY